MRRGGRFNGYFYDYFHSESKPPCFIMTTCAPNIINDCTCLNCEYSLDVTEYLFLYNRRCGNIDEDDRIICKPIIFPCLRKWPQYDDYYTPREVEIATLLLVNVEFEFIEKYLYFIQRYPKEFYKAVDAKIVLGQKHGNGISPIERRSYYCYDCDRKYCCEGKVNSYEIRTVAIAESQLLSMCMYYQLSCTESVYVEEICDSCCSDDYGYEEDMVLKDHLESLDINIIEELINGNFPEIFKQLLLKFQNLINKYMRVRLWFKPVKNVKQMLEFTLMEYYIGRGVKKKVTSNS